MNTNTQRQNRNGPRAVTLNFSAEDRERLIGVLLILAVFLAFALAGAALGQGQATVHEKDEKMTLNLPGTPLGAFLKIVSQKSGLKLVSNSELSARPISIYLPDVTAREALDAVCAAYGLTYQVYPGTKIMVLKEKDADYFTLEHADAKKTQALALALAGEGATVAFDESSNTLAVQGSTQGVERVRSMISRLDEQPKQVLIEATLAELTDDAQKDLGISWTDNGNLVTFRGAARATKLPFDKAFQAGADSWTYGTVSFQNFLVRLQALEQDGKANVLANPRIAAVNNKEAKIEIVTRTVIGTKRTFESETSERVTEEPLYADVGITLTTTPRIHPDGKITLHVVPSVSTSSRSSFFDEGVDTFNRQAETTLILRDGQTIAIGGLRRNDVQETVDKVPLLGDLPALGKLFTRNRRTTRSVELVVFLTPRLLTDERIAEDVSAHKQRMSQNRIDRQELPKKGK